MSKTNYKNYRIEERNYNDGEEIPLSELKKKDKDKRKKKRFDRALKTKNIDELLNYEDEDIE